MTTLYKVLGPDAGSVNGGTGSWPKPSGKRPGKWMPEVEVDPCRSGYHLTTAEHLLDWIGPRVWVAEFHPDAIVVAAGDKLVGSRARLVAPTCWDDRTARLFAADCAERVLPIFERDRPGDDRPRKAIEAARLFAEGTISRGELAAARDAARDAAWDAAWDAARAAARDAAWAAERRWQTDRLLAYLNGETE